MKIDLGTKLTGGPVRLDVELLLRTRLLIQANSGQGKSWLLRRLAEQLYGKVQVIIIDPEGEFASLREQYGYVLVGDGGETPADIRSAGLVAEKLLELRASAVCDLFETFRKTPTSRSTWVRQFCHALLDAPKKLWHPLVLIIDEIQVFVPERGHGESEASEAVIGIGTAGRKRGYCLVGATQRLGKVRKDLTAELRNRLVGGTFEDIDVERAADLLSVLKEERRPFFEQMRLLEPGQFFAFGAALSKTRCLFRVGPVTTTHPEMGSSKHAAAPPPLPEQIQHLLPKLADLPKEAEQKALTEQALRAKIRELEGALRQARSTTPSMPNPEPMIKTVPVLKDGQLARIEILLTRYQRMGESLMAGFSDLARAVGQVGHVPMTLSRPIGIHTRPTSTDQLPKPALPASFVTSKPATSGNAEVAVGSGGLRRMLIALAQRPQGLTARQLGLRAGLSSTSGSFGTYLAKGRTSGWIEGGRERMRITEAGLTALGDYEPLPTGRDLLAYWLRELGESGAARMLSALADVYPRALSKGELGDRAGLSASSGSFGTYLSRLRTLELVTGRGELQISAELVEEGGETDAAGSRDDYRG